jgi:hypothetical protein
VKRIRPDWLNGKSDNQAAREMLSTLRQGNSDAASELVVEMLNRGVSAQSIYDGLFLASAELLARQPGIVSLHAVTTTNALHYAFQSVSDDETRRLILLQNAAFLPMFLESMRNRGTVANVNLDGWQAPESAPADAADIFHLIGPNTSQAAQAMLGYLERGGDPETLLQAARRLVFLKGNDAHDYKFSSAVFEDYYAISPPWRNRFLATSVYRLRGTSEADNSLVERTRAALQG